MKEWERDEGRQEAKQWEKQVASSSHSYSYLVVSLSEAKKNILSATPSTHINKEQLY